MTRSSVAILLCGLLLSIPAVPQQTQSKGSQSPTPQAQPAPQPSTPPAQAAPKPATPPAQTAQQPATKFFVNPTEVILPVTVTDGKGRYLSNLEEKDFRIQDEGRTQKITYFYH